MSEPAPAHVSLSATGYADGLGRRSLEFDREAGVMLERLHLRAEFGAFEPLLRQRLDRLTPFDDARFAAVRAVERQANGTLTVLSAYVTGDRLCDLLDAATNLPAHEATSPSVDAALGFLLEVLPALEAFHAATGCAHGAVAPGRITLTSSGQVVLLDTLYGQVFERLQLNRRRLWNEFGLAVPAAGGPSRFDRAADISQASLAAMMIVLGRPLRANDYPDGLPDLITEVIEIAQIRGSSRFASDLHKFLHRTLPLPARRAHESADEAAAEVRQVAREIGVQRCRTALTAFVSDTNRVIADARGAGGAERSSTVEIPFAPAPEVTFDESLAVTSAIDSVAEPAPAASSFEESVADSPPAELGYEPSSIDEIAETARGFNEAPAPEPVAEPEPEPLADPEPEPVPLSVEPVIEEAAPVGAAPPPAFLEPEPASPAAPVVAAEPAPQPDPVLVEPEPVVVPAAAAKQPEPEPGPAESKRARRNARRYRDKLRSHAEPPAAPAPPMAAPLPPPPPAARPPLVRPTPAYAAVMPLPSVAPPAPPPRKIAQPLREEAPIAMPALPVAPLTPVPIEPPAAAPQPMTPIGFRSDPAAFRGEPVPFKSGPLPFKQDPAPFRSEPVAFKAEPTIAFKNAPTLGFRNDAPASGSHRPGRERREPELVDHVPFSGGLEPAPGRKLPWRLIAAAVLVVGVGIGAGRKFLPSNEAAEAAPLPSKEVVAAAKVAEESGKVGTIVLTTEPAGAHVLLDGKEMGDSPLTLENVPAGKHALSFITASASVKKIVRVEPGKTVSLDVAVFSGWIAVYSPIALDIAENGRALGSSEQGRLMLSPGRHQLTLTNSEFGYTSTQTVEIEPGEERPISVEPTGELNANASPWAEVWMNGKKIGETPVAHLAVALGTHELVFKNPQFPDRHVTVTVTAASPITTSVDFSK